MATTAVIFATYSLLRSAQTRLSIFLQPIPEPFEFFFHFRLDSLELQGIEFSSFWPTLRKKIIFDLRLGARPPYRNACLIFEFKDRHLLLGNFVAFNVTNCFCFEISDARHLRTKHFRKRMLRVRFDQSLDFARAFRAFENERAVFFREVTED